MNNPSLPPRPSLFEQRLLARQKNVWRMLVGGAVALGGMLLIAVAVALWPSAGEPEHAGRPAARDAAGALETMPRGDSQRAGAPAAAPTADAPPAASAPPVEPAPAAAEPAGVPAPAAQVAAGTSADKPVAAAADAGRGATAKPVASKPGARPGQPSAPPSKLDSMTPEQRAMLQRMGAGEKITPAPGSKAGEPAKSPKPTPGLSAAQLSSVVSRGRPNLQRCYETALRGSGSEMAVRVDISITVSAAGNVTRVSTSGASLPGMEACITRSVKQWHFPSASEPTETKFPIVFQPGS